jgi:hypothetical protein
MKIFFGFVGIVIALSAILFLTGVVGKGCNQAVTATHVDDATNVYEEFQAIYNTCSKLNTDLGNMKDAPSDDPMFAQFSKAQRVLQIKTQLNRWVEEYNGKSKMWGRNLWKSPKLPFELRVEDYSNYNRP